MTIIEVTQGSDEWKAARCGKFTASRIADLMATTKSGYAASRKNYLAELLIERMTGEPTEHFVSKEMQWGTEHEPEARTIYEFQTDSIVQEVGFVMHQVYDFAGASPDGLIGSDGALEIKCPNSATHIETLKTGKVPHRYYAQMQWVMECAEREWCDFVSFDPRFRDQRFTLFRSRVRRDEEFLTKARSEVEKAEAELTEQIAALERAVVA